MSADTVINKAFVKRLSSRMPEERQEAERTLEALGSDGLDALLRLIAREQKIRERWGLVFRGLWVIVLLHCLFDVWQWHVTGNMPEVGPWDYVMWIFGGTCLSTTHKGATVALSRYDDVRAVGPFAAALQADGEVGKAVRAGLIKLLPRMQASDAHLLNESQRAELNRELVQNLPNPELVKAILLAWQQVGDEKAIPYVERLSTDRLQASQIRQAAADCLPFLRQSAASLKASQTLLRASDTGQAHPEELLRAASDHLVTDPNELLRAEPAGEFRSRADSCADSHVETPPLRW